jgi:hypothetical protein
MAERKNCLHKDKTIFLFDFPSVKIRPRFANIKKGEHARYRDTTSSTKKIKMEIEVIKCKDE